ncbi:related to 3-oxoacyl-[acyl-carrier-protein] reductase [Phialocephala subalpina]|uniref:Related to 3-oxoacyl-[acyl-carrier-protein] reductase n=1 Tax=Phialocephala subalpina TaxID=576137 RepID=A0A1L7XS71_9HELO|nr:related to 3-oxoacyl-[acyl-carrier-protein] reductase [Phialocephala subalpina]
MASAKALYTPEAPHVLEQDLAGKVAIVTGASRGIGRAIALHLASRGASILGTCSSPESMHHIDTLSRTVSNLYASSAYQAPKVIGIAANVLSLDTPKLIVEAMEKDFGGKLDILVNNAAHLEGGGIGQLEVEHVQRCLMGNVQTLVMTMELLFRKEIFQLNSRILNISSEATRTRFPNVGMDLYAATKSAMESLTRSWADALGSHPTTAGTTVNALLVGVTGTAAHNDLPPDMKKIMRDMTFSKVSIGPRIGEPEDIADIAGLLVSERARWITGSVVCANGGTVKVL